MWCLRFGARRPLRVDGRAGSASIVALVTSAVVAVLVLLVACSSSQPSSALPGPSTGQSPSRSLAAFTGADLQQTVNTYCVRCHNQAAHTANLGFDTLNVSDPASHPAIWER